MAVGENKWDWNCDTAMGIVKVILVWRKRCLNAMCGAICDFAFCNVFGTQRCGVHVRERGWREWDRDTGAWRKYSTVHGQNKTWRKRAIKIKMEDRGITGEKVRGRKRKREKKKEREEEREREKESDKKWQCQTVPDTNPATDVELWKTLLREIP